MFKRNKKEKSANKNEDLIIKKAFDDLNERLVKERELKVKKDTITEIITFDFVFNSIDMFSRKYSISLTDRGYAVAVVTDIFTDRKRYFYNKQDFINWGIKQFYKSGEIFEGK